MIDMGPRTVVLAAIAVFLAMGTPFFIAHHLKLGQYAQSPQTVKLALGGTAVVAGGRAKLWYAGDRTGADVEIRCRAETKMFEPGQVGDTCDACGIHVELVELDDRSAPPRATYKVSWDK